jgi:hypothetical protein
MLLILEVKIFPNDFFAILLNLLASVSIHCSYKPAFLNTVTDMLNALSYGARTPRC